MPRHAMGLIELRHKMSCPFWAASRVTDWANYRPLGDFYCGKLFECYRSSQKKFLYILYLFLTLCIDYNKNVFGYNLCDFFTNLFGHPGNKSGTKAPKT
jgi:hypothetical protein